MQRTLKVPIVTHKKNYTTVADLLADDGFISWYCNAHKIPVEEWDLWILENNKNAQLAEKAVQLLSVIISPDIIKHAAGEENQVHASFNRLVGKMIKCKKEEQK